PRQEGRCASPTRSRRSSAGRCCRCNTPPSPPATPTTATRQPRRATMLMAAAGVVLATAAGLLATRAAPGHPGVQAVRTAVVRLAGPGAAAPAAGCGLPNPATALGA